MRADTSPQRRSGTQGDWRKALLHPAAKPILFCAALLPAVLLVVAAATNQLGANPAEALIRSTGDWALRALCVVLALTPLRVVFAVPALARWRRMLGLFAFFYAFLHVLSYSWLDMGLDLPEIFADIVKRPFILVGTLAFVVLWRWRPLRSSGPFGRWGASAGRRCTARCTQPLCWRCCISSGCALAKTTLPKWHPTPSSSRRCWAGGCGAGRRGDALIWPIPVKC